MTSIVAVQESSQWRPIRTPLGARTALSRPPSWWVGARFPFLNDHTHRKHALGLSGLEFRPFRSRFPVWCRTSPTIQNTPRQPSQVISLFFAAVRGSVRVGVQVSPIFQKFPPASVLRQHNRGVRPRGFVRDGGGGGVLTSYRRRTPLNKKLSYCWDSARSGRSTYPNRNCQRQHDLCRPEFYLTNSCLISGILYRVWRVMLCQLTRWTVSKPTLDE